MNDEQGHDTEHVEKGILDRTRSPKQTTNDSSQVKPDPKLANGEASDTEKVKGTGTLGAKLKSTLGGIKSVPKQKGTGTQSQAPQGPSGPEIKPVSPPAKEPPKASPPTKETPTVSAPAKEPPKEPEKGSEKGQGMDREKGPGEQDTAMSANPPDDDGVISYPNTLDAEPTVTDPHVTAMSREPQSTKTSSVIADPNESVLDDFGANSKQKQAWRPSVTSQRILDAGLAGLNMFGNALGGANKAFSMLRGLASALTSDKLMSDPTLPARGFLQAMDQSGQIVEDGIKQVGEVYGIKDGVKRDDLVGTYKGAQYYREKQQIENAEKDYYGKVGTALSDVLGSDVDVNDPVSIQNALSKMDETQLSDLNDRLFGQNGSLKDMYDGLMTASNPNKVQTTQAKLLQELNKALKGQATDLSRQAGLDRSMANAQLRQVRLGRRQAQDMQKDRIADARRQMKDPASMAGMAPEEQMEVIIRGVLGRRIDSGDIPVIVDANGNEIIDTDALDIQDLNSLSQALEGSPIYNDPATHDAADALYQEVRRRVESAHQQRTQFRQQQRQSRMNELMNYPLDYDIADKGGDRDTVGIPRSREGRKRLYRTAWYTQQDLMANGGSQEDIDMCENIMFMCDMAGRRDDAMNTLDSLYASGAISEAERSHYMGEIDDAYRQAAEALAVTKEDRDARAARKEDWTRGPATERAEMRLEAMETLLEETRTGHMQQERERRRQQDQARREAQRSAELKPYQNSLIDMQIRTGRNNVQRDSYGIPMNSTSCRDLRDDAFARMNDLIAEGASEEDVELCANVHALCNAALKRDQINKTIDRLEKAGKISKQDADLARQNAYNKYRALAERLPVTVDVRNRMAGKGREWRQDTDSDMLAYDLDGTIDFLRGVEEDYDRGVREERDAQSEQRRQQRDAQSEQRRQARAEQREQERQARARQREQERQERIRQREQEREERRNRRREAEAREREAGEARDAESRAREDALAMRDNEWGISTSADPKYRKKDLQRFSDQLKDIESAMANASSPEEMLRLTKEKLDVEEKMRMTHQENHIQNAMTAAGALPNADEVRKQLEGLRGKYTDWNEFGKALNEIRTSNGLKTDTAWSTSRRLEEAQRAQARADAHGKKMDQMIDLLKEIVSGQGTINNSIWTSSHQMFSEFEDYLDRKFKGQAQNIGRNREALIREFKKFYTETVKKDAKESLDGMVSAIADHMTSVCGDMETTIRGLSEDAQEKFLPMMQEVTGNTARITRQLKGYYDGTNKDVGEILKTLNDQVSAIENLQATVKGMQPLGGQYIQGPLKIDKKQWDQLSSQFQDFDSYRQSVDNLIQAYNSKGQVPSADDIANAVLTGLAGYNPFQQSFEGNSEGSGEIVNMLKKFEDTRQKYDRIADEILAFNEGRNQFAIPASLVDDWNEFQEWKKARDQPQPQAQEAPSPASTQETGREVGGIPEPPVEEPAWSQDEQYEEAPADADTEIDEALERLKEFPELQARLRENPEQAKMMYITDEKGRPIHQTFQYLMKHGVSNKLFGENTGPTIMQMADDLFGQTSSKGLHDARDDWYSIAQSEGSEAERKEKMDFVTNMATIAGNALKDVFRETAERNLGMASGAPTELTGEQGAKERAKEARDKARDIRHFFKLMGEEGDWQTPSGQPQAKPRLTPEQKAQQEREYQQKRQDMTDFILGNPTNEKEKAISDMVKDRLFYSKGRPTWKDYDELLTDLENDGSKEARKAYDNILNREIIPRLFTLQKNGGATERGEALQELVDKAMEFGRAGTNKARAEHFDPKTIVANMLRGPSSYRTGNNSWNNSFNNAFQAAKEWKDLDSRIQNMVDNPDSEGTISAFGPQVKNFLETNQKALDEITGKIANKELTTTSQINGALKKLEAIQKEATKLTQGIGAARDKVPTQVFGKYNTSRDIPEETLNRIREARRALAEGLTPNGELKEFAGEGKYAKLAKQLRDMKYESQVKDVIKEVGATEEEARQILDKAYLTEEPDKTLKEFLKSIKEKNKGDKKGGKKGGKKDPQPQSQTQTQTQTTGESVADKEKREKARQNAVDLLKKAIWGKTRDEQVNGLKARYTRDAKKLNEDAGMLGLRGKDETWEPTDENIAKIADAVWGKVEPAPGPTAEEGAGTNTEQKKEESKEINTEDDFGDFF